MNLFVEAWQFIVAHPERFLSALWTHIALSASALSIAVGIAVPAGVALAGSRRAAQLAIATANVGRTVPSLAVLALVMPILGTGFVPSLFALTLLALPPILINTYTAIRQVEPDIVDAARGMGMTRREIVRKVVSCRSAPAFADLHRGPAFWEPRSRRTRWRRPGRFHNRRHRDDGAAAACRRRARTLLAIGADRLFGALRRALTPAGLRT
jgi:osmoprotectant transport system permease protein